jgi:hypothetical protein
MGSYNGRWYHLADNISKTSLPKVKSWNKFFERLEGYLSPYLMETIGDEDAAEGLIAEIDSFKNLPQRSTPDFSQQD